MRGGGRRRLPARFQPCGRTDFPADRRPRRAGPARADPGGGEAGIPAQGGRRSRTRRVRTARIGMTEVLTPDICIIGAGSGGLSVAAAAAAFGVPVVLVEKAKMGGDCLNYGCVPSKALLAAAKQAAASRRATPFGLTLPRSEIDFAKVNAHVHGVIAAIAPNDSRERFTGLGVHVIEGAARFKDAATVTVGDVEVKPRRFVIATGSRAALPPIDGLAETAHF